MTSDIVNATDPDLRASMAALQRAADLARKEAIQTDTGIVIIRDGQRVNVSAKELLDEKNRQAKP